MSGGGGRDPFGPLGGLYLSDMTNYVLPGHLLVVSRREEELKFVGKCDTVRYCRAGEGNEVVFGIILQQQKKRLVYRENIS